MNIVYLSTAAIPSRTANSVHIMKMCAALVRNGHQVILFTTRQPKAEISADMNEFEYYGVPANFSIKRIYYPPCPQGGYFYAFLLLIQLLKPKPDLILSRNLLSSFFASFVRKLQILELHQMVQPSSRLQIRMFNRLIGLRHFKLLVVISKPLKQIFLSKHDIPASRICVAPDGADLPNTLKGQNKIGNGRLQVGYVGHLYAGRGIELIMDLAKSSVCADFHIVGGTNEDIERVRKQAVSTENVTIHGFMSPAKAECLRLEMDVLLAPYQDKVGLKTGTITTEKWMSPLKIFEYMAAGKAIIVSDLPVLHEVLEHDVNCFFCKPGDISAWLSALKRLHQNPELRKRLGARALQDLKTKYSWDIRADRIIRNLDRTL